jgi:hypothetical protein
MLRGVAGDIWAGKEYSPQRRSLRMKSESWFFASLAQDDSAGMKQKEKGC